MTFEVSSVFWPCAICYGILIPSFLFTLYARQHVVLRYSRVPLELHEGHQEETLAVGVQDGDERERERVIPKEFARTLIADNEV